MDLWIVQQCDSCVEEFIKTDSVIDVQCTFRQQFGINGRGLS